MELPEGLPELTVCDLLVLDVDGMEDRLVEQTPLLVVAAPVQLVGLCEQSKAGVDEPGAVGEVGEVLLGTEEPRWGLEIIKLAGRPSGSVYPLLDIGAGRLGHVVMGRRRGTARAAAADVPADARRGR
nr:hypothetical protein [Lentzea tibetensis]